MSRKSKLQLYRHELFELKSQIQMKALTEEQQQEIQEMYQALLQKYREEMWRVESEKYQGR